MAWGRSGVGEGGVGGVKGEKVVGGEVVWGCYCCGGRR